MRHAVLVWIGIILNLGFVIPLLFSAMVPRPVRHPAPTHLAALCGVAVILSVFYIPATLDFGRYRVFAWLAVFPSRTFGTVFFFLAVILSGQPRASWLASWSTG